MAHAQQESDREQHPDRFAWQVRRAPVGLDAVQRAALTADGPMTPGQALALQSSAGNAAVVQRLAQDKHVHDAGCGHRPPVQRSAVDNVLSKPGRPLDGPLRSEMEARFGGEDFSRVRVHNDTVAQRSAAELGAEAYTSGTDIVYGAATVSKETLAHELEHTRQQLRGQVTTQDNGNGVNVSPEKAPEEVSAATVARQVMRGPVPNGDGAVQRAVKTGGKTGTTQAPGATPAHTVQRVRRSTREEMEGARSASAFKRTADLMRSQGNAAKAAELEAALDKNLPLPAAGTVVFANEMLPQQRHGARFRLTMDTATMIYSMAPHLGRKQYGPPVVANGKYNFVVPASKPHKIMASQVGNQEEGHSALAKGRSVGTGHVYWAGTAVFNNGVLEKWTNDSGHYRPTGEDAGQVQGITGGAFPADDRFKDITQVMD